MPILKISGRYLLFLLASDPDYQDVLNQMKVRLQDYLDALPGKFEL